MGALGSILGRLGASWLLLGGFLGSLGGVLEALASLTRKRTIDICFLGPSWAIFGASWSVLLGRLGPSWPLRWSQHRKDHDPKFDQTFDASWDRFLAGFKPNLGRKMEPSWQNEIKNVHNCESRFFGKTALKLQRGLAC